MGPWGALIGAAVGTGMGMFKAQEDQAQYMEQKDQQASLARLSPWTRLAVTDPGARPSEIGTVMQGTTTGAAMGSGMGGGQAAAPKQAPQTGSFSMAMNQPNALNTQQNFNSRYNQQNPYTELA